MNIAKKEKFYAIVDQHNGTFDPYGFRDKMDIYSNKKEALNFAAEWSRLHKNMGMKYSVVEVFFGKKVKR